MRTERNCPRRTRSDTKRKESLPTLLRVPSCRSWILVFFFFITPIMAAETSTLQSVPVADVKITDGFWANWIKVVKDNTIEHNFKQCEIHGRFRNFDRAAGKLEGGYEGKFVFDDSD